MTINLSFGSSHAVVDPQFGGILKELKLSIDDRIQRDILWAPDELSLKSNSWPQGGMPILFPFAGRVFHDGKPFRYHINEKIYEMPLHGFAYSMPWQVTEQTSTKVKLVLNENLHSLQFFPFSFQLEAIYELKLSALLMTIRITHKKSDLKLMPVALGIHPYFSIGQSKLAELKTSAKEEIAVETDCSSGASTIWTKAHSQIVADPKLHNLILGKLETSKALINFCEESQVVEILWDQKLCNYLVLWSREPKNYFCVEPWMALPDAVNHQSGCKWLSEGESLTLQFSIVLDRLTTACE